MLEDLIFLIFTFLSLIGIKIKGKNSFFYNYLEIENTKPIRGIFVWMIFFRHYTGYYKRDLRKISIKIDKSLEQNIVSLFLFYSGYGINLCYKNKGIKYIKTLPIKSLVIFIKSQLILLIFILNNIILGKKISFKYYLYSVIFKKGIGNSYWFAFTIITLYIHSFLSFILINNKKFHFLGIIFLTIICQFHVKFVYKYYHPKEIISVDTIICFIIGFYYSFFQVYLDKLIMLNDYIYFSLISTCSFFYHKFYFNENFKNIYCRSIRNGFFTILIIMFSMKIQFKNEFLEFMNFHSYSIYLIQRAIMIFIHEKKYFKNNEFVRFLFEFFTVLSMSCFFDKYSVYIDIMFQRKIKFIRKEKKKDYNFIVIDNNLNLSNRF